MTTIAQEPRSTSDASSDFHTGEELRCVLSRLHAQGTDAWAHDPVAAELMEYACEKYGALAVKHGLDPWEAASAAFDAMRTRAVREARDPWAVITHAVRITCVFEERAQGLLCSVHQARRSNIYRLHDPERFSDRMFPLVDDHPVFAVTDHLDGTPESESDPAATFVHAAVEDAIEFLVLLRWPSETARTVTEHVCDALLRAGSRTTAFDALRHDRHACALLDVSTHAWHVLLRALLGTPAPALAATAVGRGVLLRLLIGETIPFLLSDNDLVEALSLAAPGVGR